jgi:hypothetical protein
MNGDEQFRCLGTYHSPSTPEQSTNRCCAELPPTTKSSQIRLRTLGPVSKKRQMHR